MERKARVVRQTNETKIDLALNLDGKGTADVSTGIGYFDHMLEQLAFHGMFDLCLRCEGDLHIDCHHTVEDTALALGQAVNEALGERKSIRRYGWCLLPMDETLVRTALDLSGRPDSCIKADFTQTRLGELDVQMVPHFFKSFAMSGRMTVHIQILYGQNDHHRCEAMFKGFARAFYDAATPDPRRLGVTPSTKGVL